MFFFEQGVCYVGHFSREKHLIKNCGTGWIRGQIRLEVDKTIKNMPKNIN